MKRSWAARPPRRGGPTIALAALLIGCGGTANDAPPANRGTPTDTLSSTGVEHPSSAPSDTGAASDASARSRDAGDFDATDAAPVCPWEIEPLLAKVPVEPSPRVNCGSDNASTFGDDLEAALNEVVECFSDALSARRAAEFSVNYCIDCTNASTFVSTSTASVFHVFRLIDPYGTWAVTGELLPPRREGRVESCESVEVVADDAGGAARVRCVGPTMLFACKGEISDLAGF